MCKNVQVFPEARIDVMYTVQPAHGLWAVSGSS